MQFQQPIHQEVDGYTVAALSLRELREGRHWIQIVSIECSIRLSSDPSLARERIESHSSERAGVVEGEVLTVWL